MKSKIAVFPGSFDPITNGHINLVERSISLFEKIIIGVGANSQKQSLFSLDQRIHWLREIFAKYPMVEVDAYNGLTIDFCKEKQAGIILRGLRSAGDFEYEKSIALINRS
ncbi:MAG: pantetheine-phosphate adenylyltransferase, partial [Chitinophagales bacterium]